MLYVKAQIARYTRHHFFPVHIVSRLHHWILSVSMQLELSPCHFQSKQANSQLRHFPRATPRSSNYVVRAPSHRVYDIHRTCFVTSLCICHHSNRLLAVFDGTGQRITYIVRCSATKVIVWATFCVTNENGNGYGWKLERHSRNPFLVLFLDGRDSLAGRIKRSTITTDDGGFMDLSNRLGCILYLRRFEGSLGSLVYLTITRLFHTEEVYNDIQIPASFNSRHVYTIETEANRKLWFMIGHYVLHGIR